MGFNIPSSSKPPEKKEEVSIIFSNKDIEEFLNEGVVVNSDICSLIVGLPKTAKTGICLDSRTEEEIKEGKKLVYIEFNHDHGGRINKKVFHKNDPSILVIDPTVVEADDITGEDKVNYIKTMAKIKATLRYIKENKEKLNIKTIIVDGADRFLSEICEQQMRLDEHIDVTGGVSLKYWLKRNKYFHDVMDMLLNIDVDKYIISHPKEDKETGKITYGVQKDFPDRVHQILMTRYDEKTNKFYVKVIADRRDRPDLIGKEFITMEIIDGKKKWYGFRL